MAAELGTTAHLLLTVSTVVADATVVVIRTADRGIGPEGLAGRAHEAGAQGVTLLRVISDWLVEHPDIDEELLLRYVDALTD